MHGYPTSITNPKSICLGKISCTTGLPLFPIQYFCLVNSGSKCLLHIVPWLQCSFGIFIVVDLKKKWS